MYMSNCVSLCNFPSIAYILSSEKPSNVLQMRNQHWNELHLPLRTSSLFHSTLAPPSLIFLLEFFLPFCLWKKNCVPWRHSHRVKITARSSQQDSWVVGISKASRGNKDVLWFRVHVSSLLYWGHGVSRGFKRAGSIESFPDIWTAK